MKRLGIVEDNIAVWIIYEYNLKSLVINSKNSSSSDSIWFDKSGNIIKAVYTDYFDRVGFDENNLPKFFQRSYRNESTLEYEISYKNESNKITQFMFLKESENDSESTVSIEFEINKQGLIFKARDNQTASLINFEYDDKDRLIRKTTTSQRSKSQIEKIEYFYLGDSKSLNRISRIFAGNETVYSFKNGLPDLVITDNETRSYLYQFN